MARECFGCWGAKEAETEGGRGGEGDDGGKKKKREIITLQFACRDKGRDGRKDGREREGKYGW